MLLFTHDIVLIDKIRVGINCRLEQFREALESINCRLEQFREALESKCLI